MKVIKFRAWNKRKKLMMDSLSMKELFKLQLRDYEENDYKWMQFIGVIDINKVQIFEGDIIHVTDMRSKFFGDYAKIVYAAPSFVLESIDFEDGTKEYLTRYIYESKYEIVGNIHEHPHLLKETYEQPHLLKETNE